MDVRFGPQRQKVPQSIATLASWKRKKFAYFAVVATAET